MSHFITQPSEIPLLNLALTAGFVLLAIRLAAKVGADSALKLSSTLAQHVGQVLQIVTGRDTKLANKVLGGSLEIAVILLSLLLFGPAKIGVGRNGRGTLEALQPGLGLGLRVGVKAALAEELVR